MLIRMVLGNSGGGKCKQGTLKVQGRLWECKEGKLISTETRRALLGRGRNKYDTLFILTASEEKTFDYSAWI